MPELSHRLRQENHSHGVAPRHIGTKVFDSQMLGFSQDQLRGLEYPTTAGIMKSPCRPTSPLIQSPSMNP
jgi:hypothetical protein